MIAVDLMAYLKATGRKPPQGGMMAQWALRVRQWGAYVKSKIPDAHPGEACVIIDTDRKNGFPPNWWNDAGR